MMLGEVEKFGKSSLKDMTKDGVIQTVQTIDNKYY